MNAAHFLTKLVCCLVFIIGCKTTESLRSVRNDREVAQRISTAPTTIFDLAAETKTICKYFHESLKNDSDNSTNEITMEYLKACNKIPERELVKMFSDKEYIQQVNNSAQDEEKQLEDSIENSHSKQESNAEDLRKKGLLIAGASLATVAFIGSWVSYKEWKKIDWQNVKLARSYEMAISNATKVLGKNERYLINHLQPQMLTEVDFLGRKLNFIDIASIDFILKADGSTNERLFSNTVKELNNSELKKELENIINSDNLSYLAKQSKIRSTVNPNSIDYDSLDTIAKARQFKAENIKLADEIIDLRNNNITNTKALNRIDPPSTSRFQESIIAVGIFSALAIGTTLAGALALTDEPSRLQKFYFNLGVIQQKLLGVHSRNG